MPTEHLGRGLTGFGNSAQDRELDLEIERIENLSGEEIDQELRSHALAEGKDPDIEFRRIDNEAEGLRRYAHEHSIGYYANGIVATVLGLAIIVVVVATCIYAVDLLVPGFLKFGKCIFTTSPFHNPPCTPF